MRAVTCWVLGVVGFCSFSGCESEPREAFDATRHIVIQLTCEPQALPVGRDTTIYLRARLANCWSEPVWVRTAWPPYIGEAQYMHACRDAVRPDGCRHWEFTPTLMVRDYVHLEDAAVRIAPGAQYEMAVGLPGLHSGDALTIQVPFEVGRSADELVEISVETTVVVDHILDSSQLFRKIEPDVAP